jgi:hypothetical protein
MDMGGLFDWFKWKNNNFNLFYNINSIKYRLRQINVIFIF